MKIEFQNSIVTLSFFCRITDIKIAWINPCSVHHLVFQEHSPVLKLALSFYEEYGKKSLLWQEMTN